MPSEVLIRSSKHEDSEGHKGLIEAGGVQWMTAVSYFPVRLLNPTDPVEGSRCYPR